MKNIFATILTFGLAIFFTANFASAQCTTIQDGTIYARVLGGGVGDLITPGYDEFGYNYQAHVFNGILCDFDRVHDDGSDCDIDFIAKWNDAFLSNMDCNGDNFLDRADDGVDSFKGSGAWLTYHQSGKVEVGGKERKWTHFRKFVAVPSDAYLEGNIWYAADHTEIGQNFTKGLAMIQEISNDPREGEHGVLYKTPVGPGLGNLAE